MMHSLLNNDQTCVKDRFKTKGSQSQSEFAPSGCSIACSSVSTSTLVKPYRRKGSGNA